MPSKKTAPAPPGEKETPVSVRSIDRQDEMLWIAGKPPLPSDFPPCIKAIIDLGKAERGEEDGAAKGRHRMAAVLASFWAGGLQQGGGEAALAGGRRRRRGAHIRGVVCQDALPQMPGAAEAEQRLP